MRGRKILLLDYPGNNGRHGRIDSTHGTAFWGSSSGGGLGILGTWTGGIGPWRGGDGKTGIRGHWVLIPGPRQGVDGRPCGCRGGYLGGCLLGGHSSMVIPFLRWRRHVCKDTVRHVSSGNGSHSAS